MKSRNPASGKSDGLPRQAILIVNAMSRSGAEAFDEVRDKLIAAGMPSSNHPGSI